MDVGSLVYWSWVREAFVESVVQGMVFWVFYYEVYGTCFEPRSCLTVLAVPTALIAS